MNGLSKIRASIAAWLYGGMMASGTGSSMGMIALHSGSSLGIVLRSISKEIILLSEFLLAIVE